MHILLAVIGKLKSGPEAELYRHYAARLPWKITLKEHELKKPLSAAVRQEQEAKLLLESCVSAQHLIAMDEKGKPLTSNAFAAHMGGIRDRGVRTVTFVIGGADGLHASILQRADLCFSLGGITWPHMLVRGLLAEQLYRVHTILSGHPYHRE